MIINQEVECECCGKINLVFINLTATTIKENLQQKQEREMEEEQKNKEKYFDEVKKFEEKEKDGFDIYEMERKE